MRRLLKNVALLLILWTCLHPAYSQFPMNWTIDEVNPGEDISLYPDESNYTEGAKSCHLRLHSGAVPYLISDIFYITPGADYEFSMDILDNDTSGQVKIYADFYDAYGYSVFGEPPVFSVDSAQWQSISWQGKIPPQAAVGFILVKFYCQPNLYTFTQTSDIWIDNIKFLESNGNNLVINGGFEHWVVGVEEKNITEGLISVYPNPARDIVNIRMREEFDCIIISDLMGRILTKQNLSSSYSYNMDFSFLPEGLYIISVLKDDLHLSNVKILISRK